MHGLKSVKYVEMSRHLWETPATFRTSIPALQAIAKRFSDWTLAPQISG